MTLTLGKKIRKHRKNRGLTLYELSSHCGVSKSTISRVETDQAVRPCDDVILSIVSGLKLSKEEREDVLKLAGLHSEGQEEYEISDVEQLEIAVTQEEPSNFQEELKAHIEKESLAMEESEEDYVALIDKVRAKYEDMELEIERLKTSNNMLKSSLCKSQQELGNTRLEAESLRQANERAMLLIDNIKGLLNE